MNWKQHIFKPKWQHKDPEVRREAVGSLQDPELLAALPEICLEDEDPGVRATAARRIPDLPALSNAMEREADPEVEAVITQRIQQLTASGTDGRAPLADRMAVVESSGDRELLELVASQAPEPELRKTALARIERQGFLGDRAVQDPDPELRRLAAAAITQLSTLRRVIDESRKTDKALHQQLSERLHAELLTAGDADAVRSEALKVCQQLEVFALEHPHGPTPLPPEIEQGWESISKHVPDDLTSRYEAIVRRLSETPPQTESVEDTAPEASDAPGETSQATETAGSEPVPTDVPSPLPALMEQLEALREKHRESPPLRKFNQLKKEWERTWAGLSDPSPADQSMQARAGQIFGEITAAVEASKQAQEKALGKAGELLEQLQQQLEDGALHKALETRYALQELGKEFKNDRRWKRVNQQLSSWHGRIRELRDWHHWSNDKIRKQLIREMEILPQADLHPDALLDRVKDLQKQWKELEKSEQIPGDSHYHAAPWMWRKFSAAGHKAFAAAKPFLEKRDEIRDRHLQELKELARQLSDAAAAEEPDWGKLGKLLRASRKGLRDLDQVPQKARKRIASKLRKALEKGNSAMQGRYAEIEKQKLKLIRAAAQLSHATDTDEAIREAKRLQAEWKRAGSLWRSRENELWSAFREPLDPLFGKLKASKETERAEIQERLEMQESLCNDLKSILKEPDEALPESMGKVQGLRDGWRDIEHPNRRLQASFQDMADIFDRRIEDHRRKQADQVRLTHWQKSDMLHQLESALLDGSTDVQSVIKAAGDWPEHQDGSSVDDQLNARLKALQASGETEPISKETAARAKALCIQLEFLAGLPSPAREKDERMKYQVDRLSKSLSGEGDRLSAKDEARKVESEWLTLPLLSDKDHARFKKRIKKALEEIDRSNSV